MAEQPDQAAQVVEHGGALLAHLLHGPLRGLGVGVDLAGDRRRHDRDAGHVVRGDVVELAGHRGALVGHRGLHEGVALAHERLLLAAVRRAGLAAGRDRERHDARQPDDGERLERGGAEDDGQRVGARDGGVDGLTQPGRAALRGQEDAEVAGWEDERDEEDREDGERPGEAVDDARAGGGEEHRERRDDQERRAGRRPGAGAHERLGGQRDEGEPPGHAPGSTTSTSARPGRAAGGRRARAQAKSHPTAATHASTVRGATGSCHDDGV